MAANVIVFTIKGVTTGAVKAIQRMRESLGKIARVGGMVGVALTAAFAFAVKSIIDVGSKTENLRIRLDSLLGSTQEGGKAFKQMADFAAKVPFSYDQIMESATTLAGVVTGGADEISGWMPIIADLATVSGLSIQQTTEQVQRMMSAGAASADLFRERGITAMLGFQAGVAVSADETKKRLRAAFEDPASKFRGASEKMATTWDGVLSMIGDKWFAFRSKIADSGLFNYIKSIAIAIDQLMGEALKKSTESAKNMSDSMIKMLRNVLIGVGFVGDAFRGLEFAFAALQLVFARVAEAIIVGTFELTDAWRKLINIFPSFETSLLAIEKIYNDVMGTMLTGVLQVSNGFRTFINMTGLIDIEPLTELEDLVISSAERSVELANRLNETTQEINIEPLEMFEAIVAASRDRSNELALELDKIALKQMPSASVDDFQKRIDKVFKTLQKKSKQVVNDMKPPLEKLTEFQKQWQLEQQKFFTEMNNNSKTFAASFFKLMSNTVSKISDGVATVIVDGGDMMDTFKQIGRDMLKTLISSLIKMGIQSLIVNKASAVSQVGRAGAGAVASMAAAPFPINLGAPAFGAAMASTAAGFAAAHGGLTNVPSESTYLLQKGERVLSPNQNKDFTDFISNDIGSGSSGSGVSVENLTIHILENATNADAILEMDRSDMEELVADKIIPALNSLDAQGIKPDAISRSNI